MTSIVSIRLHDVVCLTRLADWVPSWLQKTLIHRMPELVPFIDSSNLGPIDVIASTVGTELFRILSLLKITKAKDE
jgi:hypothetical protein